MNEILLTNDNIFVSNDKFIVDNMLTDEDLDLELGPYVWNDLSSNDSNSSSLFTNGYNFIENETNINKIDNNINGLTPPETPPSSDRSSPPNFADLSTIIPLEERTQQLFAQNNNSLSNVTLLPAISLCPLSSPLNTFVPNETSISSLLNIKANNTFNSNNNNVIHNNNNINTCINNNSINTNSNHFYGENKLNLSILKREARKLRNREAASISRLRKKEYVDGLEERINGLLKENGDLRNENQKLKLKVSELEEEKKQISKRGFNYSIETNCNCRTILKSSNSNKKATLSFLAVIFMLGLNLAPFSGVLITNDKSISSVESNLKHDFVKHGPSRSLLWETNDDKLPIDVITAQEMAFNSSYKNSSYNKTKDTNCKTHINQTESLRLETDLRDWLLRVKFEKEEVSKQKRRLIKSNKLKERFNKAIPLPRLKAFTQKKMDAEMNDLNDFAIESYETGLNVRQIKYEDLLNAINRRDDTFYFLSFSVNDHLMIPPLSNNASDIRPRFSLIMPSVNTVNETSHGTNVTFHQILMMQIDCEVINTKMVLLNSSPKSKPSSENAIKKISVRNNAKTKSIINSRNSNANKANHKVQ